MLNEHQAVMAQLKINRNYRKGRALSADAICLDSKILRCPNNGNFIITAVKIVKLKDIKTMSMADSSKSNLSKIADMAIQAPSTVTAPIQEAHFAIGDWSCGLIKDSFCGQT